MESMTNRVEMKELVQVFSLEAGEAVFLTSTQTNVKPSITIFELPGVREKMVGHLNLGDRGGKRPPLTKNNYNRNASQLRLCRKLGYSTIPLLFLLVSIRSFNINRKTNM